MNKKAGDILLRIVVILMGLGIMTMSGYGLYSEISEIIYSKSSSKWKKTEAKIINSSASRVEVADGKRGLKVKFKYSYKINNKVYHSKRYAFGVGNISESEVQNYETGDKIQIYYNPDNHSLATVKQEYRFGFYTAFIFLASILGLVIGGFLVKLPLSKK